jgi:hypothetical protein
MKFKNLCISVVAANILLGASAASAYTAYCYKNPGNNNGHRYVINYYSQGYDVILSRWTKQVWKGNKYVDHSWLNIGRRYDHGSLSAAFVCKSYLNYNYATQG